MTKYKAGQKVQIENAGAVLVTTVYESERGGIMVRDAVGGQYSLDYIDSHLPGSKITILEEPPYVMPTVPGFYLDVNNDLWQLLTQSDGENPIWYDIANQDTYTPENEIVTDNAPFLRLVPEHS